MSPSSRGVNAGLLLALLAAFAVLGLNNSWLLPALDDTGVAYLLSSEALAAGEAPVVPLAPWDADRPVSGLGRRGSLVPLAMSVVMRTDTRSHVAALWVLAGAAALAALSVAWVAGATSGVSGALLAAGFLFLTPFSADLMTAVRPELALLALLGLLLGTMTYQPRWSLAHGALAALAWLAHPVGLGAVAATVVWGATRDGRRPRRLAGTVLAAIPAAALLGSGDVAHGLLLPSPLVAGELHVSWAPLSGLLRWSGAGVPGAWGLVIGLAFALYAVLLIGLEQMRSPVVPTDVHWSDRLAPDMLTERMRPAAATLTLGIVVAALVVHGDGALRLPWAPALLPLSVLVGSATARWVRREAGVWRAIPIVMTTVWVALGASLFVREASRTRHEGRGHTRARWVQSDLVRWIDNRAGPYGTLYADQPLLIYIQTGRVAHAIPSRSHDAAAFATRFAMNPGPVILTDDQREPGQSDLLVELLHVHEEVAVPEGRILLP